MMLQILLVKSCFLFSFGATQLHEAAKSAGLQYYGTETESVSFSDEPYQAVLKNTSEFGQITPGNSMKWDSIEPQPGKFSFAGGDAIAALAKANNQLLRCHTLVWHQQLPSWVTGGTWTAATLTAALQNHITNEVTHYKGQCFAWDVVNEALNDNGTFRNSVFFRVIGQDYIKIAFEAAAAADPDVKLYYNDFGTEFPGAKSNAAQAIVKSLKAVGAKIDGVGFQAHFVVGGTPSKATQIANMGAFTALGVEVAITELDIRMKLPSTDALVAQQKKDYQTTSAACVALTGCIGITVWDFDDKYSWIPSTFPGTGDGTMFDGRVTRKEAYFGALSGLVASAGNSTNSTGDTFAELTPSSFTPLTGTTNTTVTPPVLRVPTSPASSLNLSGLILVLLISLVFAALL
ncbi:glycoside hydrolase superfamily [Rhexocercosporidium sp. MPI-PUGE-AT-0058]|nr:glycoside hydrolase superfamily [Rhexocercosporidium sp. MPI-PUGE-AT-0058]